MLDVIVDIRDGSPTYGRWISVLLDDVDRRAVYLPESLSHGFCSLEDDSTVTCLCSTGYNPTAEHGTHPLDAELGIEWPTVGRNREALTYELSAEDQQAPTLEQARKAGLLPTYPARVR